MFQTGGATCTKGPRQNRAGLFQGHTIIERSWGQIQEGNLKTGMTPEGFLSLLRRLDCVPTLWGATGQGVAQSDH